MMASQAKSKGFIDGIRIIQTAAMSFVLPSLIATGASMVLLNMDMKNHGMPNQSE
jgi:hypothetical protein